ncbi:MAG: signal peptidase I [Peptococcia bacterium]
MAISDRRKEIREWIYTILIAVVLVVVIRMFLLDSRIVPSSSMEPSIIPGDRLFVQKITHHFAGLQRGEVVVFSPPARSGLQDDLIKRVIALPGDTVEIKEGKLFLNGEPQEEPYILEPINYEMELKKVPEGCIFVLGDNRNYSSDSHVWEFADISSVKGKAWVTYWPLERIRTW